MVFQTGIKSIFKQKRTWKAEGMRGVGVISQQTVRTIFHRALSLACSHEIEARLQTLITDEGGDVVNFRILYNQ